MMWRRVVVGVFVLAIVSGGGAMTWRARVEAQRLVSNPMDTRRLPGRTPIDAGFVYDDVAITTPDGLRLVAWFIPATNGALVIAQHGYKADRGEMLNEAVMLAQHGYNVLVPALRAHDLSDGAIITFGAREIDDLRQWVTMAATLPGVDARRIGVLGNSLGGTLAIQMAARTPDVRAIVTNSAFSSLSDTLDTSIRFFTGLPPFPFAPLVAFWAERETGIRVGDVDATRAIAGLSPRPVLLMQGGADEVISIASGQRLYDAAGEPKTLWFDAQVGHSRFDTARPDEYEQRVVALFDNALLGRVAASPQPSPVPGE